MSERAWHQPAVSLVAGGLFALGLGLSGVTNPAKVLGFLDLFGDWDPSLLLVMGAAVPVHTVAWRVLRARGRPLLSGTVPPLPAPVFDSRLIGGAALFGVGWGLAGVCPGPALVSLAAGAGAFVFVPAMLVGLALSRALVKAPAADGPPQVTPV